MEETDFIKQLEAHESFRPAVTLTYGGVPLTYNVPNRMTLWRVETLPTKEPSTIAWLDEIEPGSILLDVGANVGMYTIFAAKVRSAQVYAFEPESQNYALLNANIEVNGLSGRIKAYCAGFSDRDGLDTLFLSEFALGGSCHSMGEEVGFDLRPRPSPFAQGAISFSIDSAVARGMIPVPDYIKIDVDGFEHKVISGARQTLANPKVKSLIIELNPALEQHREAVGLLRELGFDYNPDQVAFAARKEGAFKDVGEWIFRRKSANAHVAHTVVPPIVRRTERAQTLAQHVLARIRDARLATEPFPHIVVDDVFPPDYYAEIQRLFPRDEQMIPLSETGRTGNAYRERLVTLFDETGFARLDEEQRRFWGEFGGWLYSPEFINGVIETFWPHVKDRLQAVSRLSGIARVRGDALLVSDQTNYAIGPHTDAAHRLVTFLFYLPQDARHQQHGTSIYRPKDPNFRCAGGPHYPFGLFDKQETIAFMPNRLLTFVRTDQSFHGVEAIQDQEIVRHLLINNIRLADV